MTGLKKDKIDIHGVIKYLFFTKKNTTKIMGNIQILKDNIFSTGIICHWVVWFKRSNTGLSAWMFYVIK